MANVEGVPRDRLRDRLALLLSPVPQSYPNLGRALHPAPETTTRVLQVQQCWSILPAAGSSASVQRLFYQAPPSWVFFSLAAVQNDLCWACHLNCQDGHWRFLRIATVTPMWGSGAKTRAFVRHPRSMFACSRGALTAQALIRSHPTRLVESSSRPLANRLISLGRIKDIPVR